MTRYKVGQVSWFNDTKGFGYLKHEGKDVFVHYTAITGEGFKSLADDQFVAFEMIDGPRGPMAHGVIRCASEQDALDIALGYSIVDRIAKETNQTDKLPAALESSYDRMLAAVAEVNAPEITEDSPEVIRQTIDEELGKAKQEKSAKRRAAASKSRFHWEMLDGELRTTVKVEVRLTKEELKAWQDYAAHKGVEFSREWLEGQVCQEINWPTFVENMTAHYQELPSTEVLHA